METGWRSHSLAPRPRALLPAVCPVSFTGDLPGIGGRLLGRGLPPPVETVHDGSAGCFFAPWKRIQLTECWPGLSFDEKQGSFSPSAYQDSWLELVSGKQETNWELDHGRWMML